MRKVVLVGLVLLALLARSTPAFAQISDRELGEKIAEIDPDLLQVQHLRRRQHRHRQPRVVLTGKVTEPKKKDDIGKRVEKIDGIRSLDQRHRRAARLAGGCPACALLAAKRIYHYPAFWRYAQLAIRPFTSSSSTSASR